MSDGQNRRKDTLSHFTPTNIAQEPAITADESSAALVNALGRPLDHGHSWTLARTLLLGLVTWGLLPILAWIKRFDDFALAEREQALWLARWVRERQDGEESRALGARASALRTRGPLRFLAKVCALAIAVYLAVIIWPLRGHPLGALFSCTYFFAAPSWGAHAWSVVHSWRAFRPRWEGTGAPAAFFPQAEALRIALTWNAGLLVAALAQGLRISMHAARMRAFANRFKTIAAAKGVEIADPMMRTSGFRFGWGLAGVLLLLSHLPGGAALMLCGAVQRSYVRRESFQIRAAMARRVRAMAQAEQPGAHLPTPIWLRRHCPHKLCQSIVPESAAFCPRCGTRVSGPVDQMA